MKRFRFPLRPIALLRAHHEMRAREAFAHSVHAFLEAESQLAAARERVRLVGEAVTAGRSGSFAAAQEVLALAAYRRECASETEAVKARTAAEQAMAERRNEYTAAHRKLEVVRRLEDKARDLYRHDAMREEQAEYDEFSNRRFSRRSLHSA